MAALKEVAREYASEIRDGIGWVIVYRTGRSWHALTVWSDLGNNEWETDDINDALEALRLDPRAVALNGYYLGHFGDMTIDDIAAGIRWHYERGTNALADDDTLTQARADIEAARQQAAEAGLPFSERLVEGPEDESNPYTYDGSMTVADYEAAQRARDAHAALVEVVADHYGGTLKGGRSIYFEAKHTDDERIEQRRLTQEQQDDLEAHHKLGAIAFVLVSVSLTDFYRVPWPVWRDMAEIYGRKYMTHAELSCYEVPATAGFIKFLHGIESEVLGKEATT